MINTRILNRIYIFLALGALFGALFLRPDQSPETARIIAGSTVIPVTIADTDESREQGLSGTPTLAPGTGKLFIFDHPGKYSFWMKDMNYPIDIVWIDEEWKVVSITEAVSPLSYPMTFYPSEPVRYVLEVNAYEAVPLNLSIGTQLHLEK